MCHLGSRNINWQQEYSQVIWTKTILDVTFLCVIPRFREGCLPLTSGYILALVFTHGIIGVYRIPNSSLHTHTAYSVLSTEIVRAYIYAVQGSSPAILADSLSIHFWASQEMSPGDNFFLRPPRSKLSSMYRLLRIQACLAKYHYCRKAEYYFITGYSHSEHRNIFVLFD